MSFFRKWYWQVGLEMGVMYVAAAVLLGFEGLLRLLLAPLPFLAGLWTLHWFLRDRPNVNGRVQRRCRHCGYDLTGNVTGLCSACGEPV